ncbi:hypothetical protein M9H77_09180 [Catharanthus roseus]|uniref:Uncharacterized protein n=1 Tax=Catharanthus roseus TaxID=4058 RepID=A0ACC0BZY2_CATRO|nr:hypothetical protein M9H77_09180 [Catharanthus roseus]
MICAKKRRVISTTVSVSKTCVSTVFRDDDHYLSVLGFATDGYIDHYIMTSELWKIYQIVVGCIEKEGPGLKILQVNSLMGRLFYLLVPESNNGSENSLRSHGEKLWPHDEKRILEEGDASLRLILG